MATPGIGQVIVSENLETLLKRTGFLHLKWAYLFLPHTAVCKEPDRAWKMRFLGVPHQAPQPSLAYTFGPVGTHPSHRCGTALGGSAHTIVT